MISVGVPISKLRAHAPRGVVRVARAITERLALVDDLQLFAVSDPFYSGNQVLLECWPMDEWLDSYPLAIPTRSTAVQRATGPTLYRPWVHYLVQFLALLHLRLFARSLARATRPVRAAIKRMLRTAVDWVGLGQPGRQAWRWMLRLVYQSTPVWSAPVVAPTRPELSVCKAAEEPIVHARIACPWPADNGEPIGARGFVTLDDLDVIVSFECFDAIWDWPVELFRCQLIGMFHDAIPFRIDQGRHHDPGGYYRSVAKMVNRAAMIVCNSVATEEDLHVFFPNAVSKSCVVHLGHDRERFAPEEATEDGTELLSLEESLGRYIVADDPSLALPATDPPFADAHDQRRGSGVGRSKVRRIAMIGDVEPRKNQAAVLRACRHLCDAHPGERIRLMIIGQVPEPNPYLDLERQARRYADVQWLGYVPDEEIGGLLRSCDAFVYASLWEGFGIPLLEAMTAGVPVVCSQNSSLPEVCGDCAFYCDPYDARSVASAISKALVLSAEERGAWVHKASQRAHRFNWSECAVGFEKVIRQLTGEQAQLGVSHAIRECSELSVAALDDSSQRAAA